MSVNYPPHQEPSRPKIYLAAPLFSLNERVSNRRLADALMLALPECDVVLPQDFKYHGKYNDSRFFREVYRACIAGVESSAACVAILDGPSADDGTCFEAGFAIARGIPVIGVRTDYRDNQEKGCNLMLSQGCTALIHRPAFDESFDALARDIARKLRTILFPRSKTQIQSRFIARSA
ncbi:MAG: nucleoside 2-deoxyribosyltransferase [Blastocatellia bacterium]|nr:nucleoside 2-deoxyribosyltransferase [Blastocatellia bacterium]